MRKSKAKELRVDTRKHEVLYDDFAKAALTGMLAAGCRFDAGTMYIAAREAYELADWMLIEKLRRIEERPVFYYDVSPVE